MARQAGTAAAPAG